jgi:hypothetical protein
MTRARRPDFGGADSDYDYGRDDGPDDEESPDDDGDDDGYTPDDDEESPEMCGLCRDEPAAKSEQYYWGRLAVCPRCALRLVALAARAVAAGARDEGGADQQLESAFRLMAINFCDAVGRLCPSLTEWLGRLKSRGGPKEGGGP